ncbi:MAG: hypothetical protein ACOYL4_10660, partial [Miltoncostaeaceae bacterium]
MQAIPANSEYLAGAKVVARDAATNAIVGTGRTDNLGAALFRVRPGASPQHPYVVTTIGGAVSGAPFRGHLRAVVGHVGVRHGLVNMNLATTVAATLVGHHYGTYKGDIALIMKRFGLPSWADGAALEVPNHGVGAARLQRFIARSGGWDRAVRQLAADVEMGRKFPNLGARRVTMPQTGTTPAARASEMGVAVAGGLEGLSTPASEAPCQASMPPEEFTHPVDRQEIATNLAAGLYTAATLYFAGYGDPAKIVGMVPGMSVPGSRSGTTTEDLEARLKAIQAQLTCISAQIVALQQSVNGLALQSTIARADACKTAIQGVWPDYELAIEEAYANPGSPTKGFTKDNYTMSAVMDVIDGMKTVCGNSLDRTLFDNTASQTGAWRQLLNNQISSSTAGGLDLVDVQIQRGLLNYFATLEWQQGVMVNDWYGFQINVLGRTDWDVYQKRFLGIGRAVCGRDAGPANVDPGADTYCGWMQNIGHVYPGDLYTDELAFPSSSRGVNGVTGRAISAYPAFFAQTAAYAPCDASATAAQRMACATQMATQANSFTGSWMRGAIHQVNGRLPLTPAKLLSYRNAQVGGDRGDLPSAPYETWRFPNASADATPAFSDLPPGFSQLSGWYSRWLDSADYKTPCTVACRTWVAGASDQWFAKDITLQVMAPQIATPSPCGNYISIN